MPRLYDLNLLHPAFRSPLISLVDELVAGGLPIAVYETARSPWRQAELYSFGRGRGPTGKTKTRAKAWDGHHQYAVAADLVFRLNGLWTWAEPEAGMWQTMHAGAARHGLRVLSFEQPHVELPISAGDLQAGAFPASPRPGDHAWRDFIEREAELWGSAPRNINGILHPGAPPALLSVDERPDLNDSI